MLLVKEEPTVSLVVARDLKKATRERSWYGTQRCACRQRHMQGTAHRHERQVIGEGSNLLEVRIPVRHKATAQP